MIKVFPEEEIKYAKLNIYFKDGTQVKAVDTTSKPFGDHDKVVAYWDENKICIVPMGLVLNIEMFIDKN